MKANPFIKLAAGVLATSLLFQGCASVPPAPLLEARSELAAAQRDGITSKYAPNSLAEAQKQLKTAEKAYDSDKDDRVVAHEAALARSKTTTAVAQGKSRKSQAEFEAAEAQRQRMLTERLQGLATRALDSSEKAEADLRKAEAARLAAEEARRRAEEARAALEAEKLRADNEARLAAERERARADELERQLAAERARKQAPAPDRNAGANQRLRDLNATKTPRGHLINIPDVLFAFDQSTLNARGLRIVQQVVDFLRDYPNRHALVEGHTDAIGTRSYNQRLSERRAESVSGAILRSGISPQRLVAVGYSEDYPVASNETDAGRAQNRRVEVYISDDNNPVRGRRGR